MPMRTINLDDPTPDPTPGTTGTPRTGTREHEATHHEAGPGTAPPRTPSITKLQGQVTDFHRQFGVYFGMATPQLPTGILITANADLIGEAWADLAAQDPKVKAALEKVLAGGAWANVIGMYVTGILLPTLAAVDKLPGPLAGFRDTILLGVIQMHPELAPMFQGSGGGTP